MNLYNCDSDKYRSNLQFKVEKKLVYQDYTNIFKIIKYCEFT